MRRISGGNTVMRWLVAGPLALVASLAAIAALPHLIPPGAGGIDHLVFPVLTFPLIWAAAFFYACLEEKIGRAALVLAGVTVVQCAVIAAALYA